jgi:DNA-directed RNA polymerase subunit M/transcription elongation factor TFIIS
MNCPKCDTVLKKEYNVDYNNYEYIVYVCPKCGYEFEDTGYPDLGDPEHFEER